MDYDYRYNYDNNYENNEPKSNIGSLILKILIIVLCVGILIWLIIELKNSNANVVYDESVHTNNVEKLRLAGEKYFFLDGNLPSGSEIKYVELATLIEKGLTSEIVDANNKVCNDLKTMLSVKKENGKYVLGVKLSCSKDEKEEIFYYDIERGMCLNCNGKTLMDGSSSKEEKQEEESKTDDNNYSCQNWSSWTSNRIVRDDLEERERTLVLGVKKAFSNTCEVWSAWTTSHPSLNNVLFEESVNESTSWVKKTSDSPIQESETIRNVTSETVGGGSYTYCPSGYTKSGNICLSDNTSKTDLTFDEYRSNQNRITNKPCDSVDTVKGNDGKFRIVYRGCLLKDTTNLKTGYSSSYTQYTYEELETSSTKQYRYCTKLASSSSQDEYTKDYYEEDKLPSGFEKVPGSEKIEYSYRLKVCEK